jgi:sec-independent protein translocase protein TatB
MFDVAPSELMVLGAVALVVIPPKDLPRALRTAGYWVGRARGLARQFRSGFDEMVREAELAEMEKKWRAENERIMREHPVSGLHLDAPAAEPMPPTDGEAPPVMVEQPVLIEAPTPVAAEEPALAEAPLPAAAEQPKAAE